MYCLEVHLSSTEVWKRDSSKCDNGEVLNISWAEGIEHEQVVIELGERRTVMRTIVERRSNTAMFYLAH